MKLAIFTPISPQATGIANYTYDLIIGLSQLVNIHIRIFTIIDSHCFSHIKTIEVINTLDSVHAPIMETHDFNQYDQILYHLGNNGEFHTYMLPILKKFGGIVHLHDLVLQQLLASETRVSIFNRQDYLHVIQREYGSKIYSYVNQLMDKEYPLWQTEYAYLLPCFEAYLRFSDACIVHSNFAYHQINNKIPGLLINKVPQLYNIKNKQFSPEREQLKSQKSAHNSLKLGIFGGIENNRKVDSIIKVLAEIYHSEQKIKFELIIVGAFCEECKHIIELPEKLGIADKVSIHHRVDKKEFFQLLNNIDLLIALREPTAGETSAVVMQALQLNKLPIVSDVGWYSELPEWIDKVSSETLVEDLSNRLKKYLTVDLSGIKYFKKQQKLLNQYIKNKWDYDEYIANYMSVLEKQSRNKTKQRILKKVYFHLNELELTQNKPTISRISEKLI